MFRTFWLRSLKSALAFSPSIRRLHLARPRTAHRCFFRPRLEPLEQRQLLSTMAAFDPVSGSLSLVGAAAGSSVEVEDMGNGSIGVIVNGQLVSSANAATLRQIRLTGGGGAPDALTLNNLTGQSLAVSTDGSVTLTGTVTETNQLGITAQSLTVEGTVSAANLTLNSSSLVNIDTHGSLSAQGNGNGGSIAAAAVDFVNVGQVRANGAKGGSIAITTSDYLNAGTISAAGSAGSGGTVQVHFTASYIDTTAARTTANGSGGVGGQVSIDGGSSGRLFSSGTFAATGTSGGDIDLFGQNIFLVAATVDASGTAGSGGRVRIGGDYQGNNPNVPNAQTVDVTGATVLRANASAGAAAGRVIIWSQSITEFSGSVSAKSSGGTGGFIEVSSHGQLTYGGNADAGKGGTLLLDPQNLVISSASDTPPGMFPQFNLIEPGGNSGYFGAEIVALSNGNIAVTDPGGVGSVYLFNGQTGALISALTGTGDGPTVTALTNGNFVILSPNDSTVAGAATWGSGTTGVSGVVSATNSLIGVDQGAGGNPIYITPLNNGNYVVASPYWHDGLGAVTWGNGTTGTTGVVSAANSLVGSTPGGVNGTSAGDEVGLGGGGTSADSGVTALTNGNYVVASPDWNDFLGAVTWCNGTTGTVGTVSASNSLVGSTFLDQIGFGGITNCVIALSNGNYVVDSSLWNNGAGAVTWGNGATGITGVVSSANSLIGSHTGSDEDNVGQSVVALTNGNYVVDSPQWSPVDNPVIIGAVTWANGTTGITGFVSAANSLTGNGDNVVGRGGVTALTNGNYVVDSPQWDYVATASGFAPLGAVTWCNGATGTIGVVSAANSLIGNSPGDNIGSLPVNSVYTDAVTALANGNYVVDSPSWNDSAGAVTWGNGATGIIGVVSAANSLVGSTPTDEVGNYGVTALTNGNYVVDSPNWGYNQGAVTWGNGATGISGAISAANSLVGNNVSSDKIGDYSITALSNGNYVVLSPDWSKGAGAATWGNGTLGTDGTVSSSNSLINLDYNEANGNLFVSNFPDGNYFVVVDNGNGAATAAWLDGTNGSTLDGKNVSDAQNSIQVGGVQPIGSGNVFVGNLELYPDPSIVTIATADPNLLTYAFGLGQTITVTPDFITRTLNTGTNVTLQASNDITVNDPITETPTGTAGNLTLEAGRSILLNASINTAGGNLTLMANDSKADGVVDSDRESGNAAITMASGVTLNTGSGKLSVDLKNSTDKTNNGSGVVTLLGITAAATTLSSASTLGISINGTTPGSYTEANVTGPINLNGASLSVVHSADTPAGSSFVIVQSTGGISGTFNGLSEGATVTATDGTTFSISYQGEGGKEVVLAQLSPSSSPPPPQSQPPAFTSANSTTFTVGSPGTFTVTASGLPTPALSESSSDTLPSGITFNATTGVLSGTPAAGSGDIYTLHFTASNSAGSVGQTFTLTVTATTSTPTITSGSSTTFTAGQGGSFTVATTGSPTPTLSESGALPSGVAFTDNGNGTATLGGTAVIGTQGTYQFSITAHNGVGSNFTQSFILTVNPALAPPSPSPVSPPTPPPAPPSLHVPPLLVFFDSLLGGVETINANDTETIVDSFFGIPLLVSTFDHTGKLVSVDLFGAIDITFLFG